MSKEKIRPEQFSHALVQKEATGISLNTAQIDELNSLYESSNSHFKAGNLVSGTVLKVDSDGVLVDINYKSDGLIPKAEFSSHELGTLKTGSSIEVILDQPESIDGNVILSYEKAKAMRAWDAVSKLHEENKPVEGVVTHKVKGGLSVDIGIPAFLPGSQIDLQRVTDFDQYVGQSIVCNIIKINQKRGNVIISRRNYLSAQRSEARQQVLETLNTDQIITGTVKNITNYGAFIDIGGVDGLLHITDMTWGRISHPTEMVKIGQPVTVKVLSFDKENEKISLGLKQLSENPWEKVSSTLSIGSKLTGTISSITDYGLFVEIEKGIEGLVHISEISWTGRISDLSKQFKVSQEIQVAVVALDKENRRMSLSIKQLDKNPWESIGEKFKVGQTITGPLTNITDFGIFVQIIPGIDGLIHISDLSWTEHIEHPGDRYKRGDSINATILNIDVENKKVSLGIKQLDNDPWETIEDDYSPNTITEGEVVKIASFGAFIKLANGIEGLVHISELSSQNVEKVEDVLSIGQKTQFRVVNVNQADRKLGLSLKLEVPVEKPASKSSSKKEFTQTKAHKDTIASYKEAPKTKSLLQIELEKMANSRKKAEKKGGQEE